MIVTYETTRLSDIQDVFNWGCIYHDRTTPRPCIVEFPYEELDRPREFRLTAQIGEVTVSLVIDITMQKCSSPDPPSAMEVTGTREAIEQWWQDNNIDSAHWYYTKEKGVIV